MEPQHTLGSDSPSSSRSSFSLDALATELGLPTEHSLVRLSEENKLHQHDQDRVSHLSERVEEDMELVKIDEEIEGFERELNQRRDRLL